MYHAIFLVLLIFVCTLVFLNLICYGDILLDDQFFI